MRPWLKKQTNKQATPPNQTTTTKQKEKKTHKKTPVQLWLLTFPFLSLPLSLWQDKESRAGKADTFSRPPNAHPIFTSASILNPPSSASKFVQPVWQGGCYTEFRTLKERVVKNGRGEGPGSPVPKETTVSEKQLL